MVKKGPEKHPHPLSYILSLPLTSCCYATPHKLRHTGATLAKQSGVALEQISEALTHSDTNITRTYVNTPNVIQMTIGEIAYRKLSQKESDRNGLNSKKDASQSELRNA